MLYVMNTSIIPVPYTGMVKVTNITVEEASVLLKSTAFTSAVGHSATAEILTSILGIGIKTNRIQIIIKSGDKILAFQLAKRLEEGQIIETVEELEAIGYSLRILKFEGV